jgi:16S rRNA (guanine527-N7)-methyltransferase
MIAQGWEHVGSEEAARAWFQSRVSRETFADLEALAALAAKWQQSINLVSNASMPYFWQRHLVDSAQINDLAPKDRMVWIDLGSGGGFPGLVIALLRRDTSSFRMHLVESNGKKCAFLREVARQLRLPVTVHTARIEQALPRLISTSSPQSIVLSARALASMTQLLDWCHQPLLQGSVALFPKGQDVDDELIEARKAWNFDCDLIQSISEPRARIVRISNVSGRNLA